MHTCVPTYIHTYVQTYLLCPLPAADTSLRPHLVALAAALSAERCVVRVHIAASRAGGVLQKHAEFNRMIPWLYSYRQSKEECGLGVRVWVEGLGFGVSG